MYCCCLFIYLLIDIDRYIYIYTHMCFLARLRKFWSATPPLPVPTRKHGWSKHGSSIKPSKLNELC